VRALQRMLAAKGYCTGAIDGIASKRTKSALTAFQRDAGLPATGSEAIDHSGIGIVLDGPRAARSRVSK
jgi:peptidoglycan hydrolase-like protein with peptidoglycan-binding domain